MDSSCSDEGLIETRDEAVDSVMDATTAMLSQKNLLLTVMRTDSCSL